MQFPRVICQLGGRLLDERAEQQLIDIGQIHAHGLQDFARAGDGLCVRFFENERQPIARRIDRLHARLSGRIRRPGGDGLIFEFLRMQPNDLSDALARNFFRLEPHFDEQAACIHFHDAAAKNIAVARANEVRRRRVSLHPRQREQAVALRLVECRRVPGRNQFETLDLVVRDESRIRLRRLKRDALLVDSNHFAGDGIPGAQVHGRARTGRRRRFRRPHVPHHAPERVRRLRLYTLELWAEGEDHGRRSDPTSPSEANSNCGSDPAARRASWRPVGLGRSPADRSI